MTSRTLTVGTVQVTAVCDVTGDFPVSLGQAFPGVEAAAWAPWRERHPQAFSGDDRWRLRDWCFVVRARDRVVLVDTGVGGPGVPGAAWIGTPGRLPAELAAAGAELSLLHTPGHTPGSQSLLVRSSPDALLLWGDVANHPAQVGEPDWGPGSDVQPEVARGTRRRLLDRVEGEGMWLAPAHFPEPFGTVSRVEGGRRWTGRS
jgi:hypothetical protein